MSITTTSPCSITRSDTSWCGLAPFGPDPTITKSACVWPSSSMAAVMSAPTSASVRPALSHSPMRACTRSIAAPALRSASISAASLRIRSSRTTGPASVCSASPSAARSDSTCSAGAKSLIATLPTVPSLPATRPNGSSPSTQVSTSTPSASVGTSA